MRDVVAIRANGSREIGSGHIRRTSLLAEEIGRQGAVPILLCNPQAVEVFAPLLGAFAHVHHVENEQKAADLLAQTYNDRILAILFDSYDLSAPQHKLYRACVPYLAALDDIAARAMDVDLLVDVNLGRIAEDYAGLVPATTEVHVGIDYQILRPDFTRLRARSLARREARPAIQRLFISMGGTDPLQMTQSALHTALSVAPHLDVDVVIGSASPGVGALRTYAQQVGTQVQLHVDATNVAQIMAGADLAIGAGGTMTWERNALGLPTLIMTIADNQMEISHHMEMAGAAVVIDARTGYPEEEVARHLATLIADPEKCRSLSKNAANLSGDHGAELIIETLLKRANFKTARN